MTTGEIAAEATFIVLRGAFNPAVFTPSWFRDQELVGDVELKAQSVEVITRDIAVFRMGWLDCHATHDGLQLSTPLPEEFERLRDAAIGVLRLLPHTPISALGINSQFHSVMDTLAEWHAVGDAIAPKQIWEGTLEQPGTRSLVLWGARPDSYGGQIQLQVEPSLQFPQSIFVAMNDHYTLEPPKPNPSNRGGSWELNGEKLEETASKIPLAIDILLEDWKPAMQRAEHARSRVVSLPARSK